MPGRVEKLFCVATDIYDQHTGKDIEVTPSSAFTGVVVVPTCMPVFPWER